MKIYEFLILDDAQQYDIVWDKGVLIDTFKETSTVFSLYALNDFFVEIEYNSAENKIVNKTVFKQGERLEKYLPQ